MSASSRELEAAVEAVSAAARVCRFVQAKLEAVRAIAKDDKSPVTVADLGSQAVVAQVLESILGPVILVAEEDSKLARAAASSSDSGLVDALVEAVHAAWPVASAEEIFNAIDRGAQQPHPDGAFWTLDPIDGTKGFLRREQYAVSLARVVRGVPEIGVLGCPSLSRDEARALDDPDPEGSLYTAVRGGGAFETSIDGRDRRKIARGDLPPDRPLVLCESVESGHTKHDDARAIMEHLGQTTSSVRLDSQAKYAVVARGRADVYLRMPTRKGYVERIWDHAAGALIAAEAGCVVSDIRGVPLDFGRGRGLEANLGVAVAPPGVHGRIISAIARLGLDSTR
jgi:3'(2'), 5'-bisphosphate nucleotidase